jgi:hypothetical protein
VARFTRLNSHLREFKSFDATQLVLGSYLSQPNRIWVGITNVNSEVTMINSLGVKCREHREKESNKKGNEFGPSEMVRRGVVTQIQYFYHAKASWTMGQLEAKLDGIVGGI